MLYCRVRPFLIKDERFQVELEKYTAASENSVEKIIEIDKDHGHISNSIRDLSKRLHSRNVRVFFFGNTFWVRFRRRKRRWFDLFLQLPQRDEIAGLTGQSLPDEEKKQRPAVL
jgi:hypothetical protein